MNAPQKLLYLAANWPEPASSAAGTRSLQLLSLFLETGWDITVMSAAERRAHSAPLPSTIHTQSLLLNDSKMDKVFASLSPDVVIFDRFMLEEQYGWRIAKSCPQAIRILDTIDLHCLREIRHQALKDQRPRDFPDWFRDSAMRELASIYRSDLTYLISDAEKEILTTELNIPESLLEVLPFLLRPEEYTRSPNTPAYSQRQNFISIGNFRHAPNADAVRHLYHDLWPSLRNKCPQATLTVFGADLPPALQQLHQPPKGFLICGRAENAIQEMERARVCLAPLRFGAGLKGKLLDAMLGGCPSVTTPIGAEGMQGPFLWPGAVEADPEKWIEAAVSLYQDEKAWNTAHNLIPPLLSGRFNRESFRRPFFDKLATLQSPHFRNAPDRLIGALLQHHQHRSTEYMSRWIEAKNKNTL
ncbi:glycosyltransferase [Kiritimatiellota bacterium B12222]|nr:glycosyltransferase [Kiritimatiellota bacterium B12222]